MENLVDILVPLSLFATAFGISYLGSRERMAMIEKGINPRPDNARSRGFANLRWGLLLMGSGLGLLAAYLFNAFVIAPRLVAATGNFSQGPINPVFLYFALIIVGGGTGLFLSYRIEKKDWAGNIEKKDI
jgi:hypothetical protein